MVTGKFLKNNEQKGGSVYKGRRILLNIKKKAISGPYRAEYDRTRLNWICM